MCSRNSPPVNVTTLFVEAFFFFSLFYSRHLQREKRDGAERTQKGPQFSQKLNPSGLKLPGPKPQFALPKSKAEGSSPGSGPRSLSPLHTVIPVHVRTKLEVSFCAESRCLNLRCNFATAAATCS